MRRVAVFGNAGGGKSTLARRLSEATGLPLYALDVIAYKVGGGAVAHADYVKAHDVIVARDTWIIDGYGCTRTSWERFGKADTLVFVDLPLPVHAWRVTKRLFQGLYRDPEGWPEKSPIIRGTLNGYRVLWPCHRHLTPRYRQVVAESRGAKRVHHLKSVREMDAFLADLSREAVTACD
jgi:adenylate kinase family enzyme